MRQHRSPLQKIRRLLRLLECLQSGREYNARDLSELCGVTRRQIFRDIKALQESGVPILYDEQQQSYRVAESLFLPSAELTLQESLALLVLAGNLGEPQHGIPLQEAARDAAVKLAGNLPAHLRSYVGELSEVVRLWSEPSADLEHARGLLDQVHRAFQQRQRLRLTYNSLFEGREIRTLVSPYRLLFSRHTWYIVGRSSLHRAVRMFHLGRVRSLELTSDHYEIPPRFSLDRHLGNAWRFVRERGPDQQVLIRFQPKVATNVSEVIWHKTQVLTWNKDGTLDFQVTVSGLGEISWWVLGYGDEAEVLKPPALRKMLAERVARMHTQYHPKPRRPRRKS
ncbi:MAG: helix-turn-helix transcriptional regulator [Planctomycetaceae bacterium]